MYRLRKYIFVLGKIYSKSEISTKKRIWTHRDQFSADFGVRGLYPRRRHCIRPLLRVTDGRRPIKTVWIDQIENNTHGTAKQVSFTVISQIRQGRRHKKYIIFPKSHSYSAADPSLHFGVTHSFFGVERRWRALYQHKGPCGTQRAAN